MTGRNLEPQVIRYAQDCHGPQLWKNYELSAFKDPSVKALTSAVQSSCKSVVTTYSARTEPEIRTNKSSWLLQWYLLLQLLKHQMAKTCKYYIPLADKTQMPASWHPQGTPRIEHKHCRPYPCDSLSRTSIIRDNFESMLTLTSLCPSVVRPYQRIKFKRVRQKTTSGPLRTIAPPTCALDSCIQIGICTLGSVCAWGDVANVVCVQILRENLQRCCLLCMFWLLGSCAGETKLYWTRVMSDTQLWVMRDLSHQMLGGEGSVPNNMLHQHAIPLLASTSCISLSSLSASLLFSSHFCPTFSWERGLKLGPRSHLVGEAIYHPQLLPAHYYPSPAAQRVITRPARGT